MRLVMLTVLTMSLLNPVKYTDTVTSVTSWRSDSSGRP